MRALSDDVWAGQRQPLGNGFRQSGRRVVGRDGEDRLAGHGPCARYQDRRFWPLSGPVAAGGRLYHSSGIAGLSNHRAERYPAAGRRTPRNRFHSEPRVGLDVGGSERDRSCGGDCESHVGASDYVRASRGPAAEWAQLYATGDADAGNDLIHQPGQLLHQRRQQRSRHSRIVLTFVGRFARTRDRLAARWQRQQSIG